MELEPEPRHSAPHFGSEQARLRWKRRAPPRRRATRPSTRCRTTWSSRSCGTWPARPSRWRSFASRSARAGSDGSSPPTACGCSSAAAPIAYSALPDGAGALKCYAGRAQLPLRLAAELDLAIGGLQRLVALQSSDGWLSLAAEASELLSMEPPMYSSAGLERALVHVSIARFPTKLRLCSAPL